MKQLALAKIIAKKIDRNIWWTNIIINKIFEEIKNQVSSWEPVSIIWFWKFHSTLMPSKNWVNPRDLTKIIIPELTRFKFTIAKDFKEKLNSK